ncbi:MAG: hypothetical protein WC141_01385 [Arcobacteraceae bacterium]
MERRNRSVEAFNQLKYIDTLDDEQRASQLQIWVEKYLTFEDKFDFDLEYNDLQSLSELFYKNLNFIKEFNASLQKQMTETQKMKAFLLNS